MHQRTEIQPIHLPLLIVQSFHAQDVPQVKTERTCQVIPKPGNRHPLKVQSVRRKVSRRSGFQHKTDRRRIIVPLLLWIAEKPSGAAGQFLVAAMEEQA